MITREEAQDMSDAHAEGLHDDLKREGCPECDRRELSSYPPAKQERPSAKVMRLLSEHRQFQLREHEAWGAVVSELRKRNVGDINAGGKDESLHDAICAWAEELAQLRMNDPNPEHAAKALRERREKYLGI